jgi:glycosyltransferase involved in cell wall biosynthesis
VAEPRKIHFVANGVFMTSIAGGDIHFLKLAEAAATAGYTLNYFGGHALSEVVRTYRVPGEVTLTDEAAMPKTNTTALRGQLSLFRDFLGRYRRMLRLLGRIAPEDLVYAVSDYWFDVLPTVRSDARGKLMVLHMEAPRPGQIVWRSRPDVDPMRLASFHYWASKEYSLKRFAACPRKHLVFLHPLMRPRLRRLGLAEEETTLVSYGLEVPATEAVPTQKRVYDVVWIGRVHRQKGIDDLLDTLVFLAGRFPGLKAIFIGNVREALRPELERRGLEKVVEFSGFVSEEEKIRLFKASRVFLMPSKHEGSPRVIGESIIAGTPVVAYEIPNYPPLFGEFARYAPPFELSAFKAAAEREIGAMRAGTNYLESMDLAAFKRENSWETTQARFIHALERISR